MDDRRAMTPPQPRYGFRAARRLSAVLDGLPGLPGIAGLAVLAGLSGCFTEPERNAGVDDFPNSIYASVDGFLDESGKAGGLGAAPPADSLLTRAKVDGPALPKAAAGVVESLPRLARTPDFARMPGLAKTALPAGLSAAASAGGCASYFTLSATRTAGTRVTLDSMIFCDDEAWRDTIKGNEHIARVKSIVRDTASGRVEIGEFADADGDGILNPVPGGESRATVHFKVVDGGVTEETRITAGPGPDGDFDTSEDNPIHSLSFSKTAAGGDTLASAVIADADSDGVAIDPLRPCLVDVDWFATGPTEDDPHAVWSRFRMRTMAYYGKVQTTYPSRFSGESETRLGGRDGMRRLNRIRLLNLEGGEDVAGDDTVLASFRVEGKSPADTLDTLETTLRMTIGDFEDKQDDSIFALHVRVAKKLGEERAASFDFHSDRPIPNGRDPESGDLAMRAEYADGTTLEVAGVITAETLDVTATLRDGKRVHAVWDRTGKGISLEVLD